LFQAGGDHGPGHDRSRGTGSCTKSSGENTRSHLINEKKREEKGRKGKKKKKERFVEKKK
jgi:hypothetical protein